MITINASFKDCIDRIAYYNTAAPIPTKKVRRNSEHSKEDIVHLFQGCASFTICEDEIVFEVDKTQEEIDKNLQEHKNIVRHSIATLKNWCNKKDEWKTQIVDYLTYKKLDWIIKEIYGWDNV